MKDCFKLSKFINIDNYKPLTKCLKTSDLLNKTFVIKHCTRYDKSKFGKPFYKLDIVLNGEDCIINTGSKIIVAELDDLTKQFSQLDELNVCVKLISIFKNYKLVDGDDECTEI